jgi:phosphatidate cytidylyltransferase
MLVGLLWSHWSFLLLFTIIHFGCWWEYLGLVEKINNYQFDIFEKMGYTLVGYGIVLSFAGKAYQLNQYGLRDNMFLPLSFAGFLMLAYGVLTHRQQVRAKPVLSAAAGLAYISFSWGLLLHLRQQGMVFKGSYVFADFGIILPLLLIFTIWINDTMAYVVGSLIGKTPLSKVSPKKTWEGTAGGVILSVAVLMLVAVLAYQAAWWQVALFCTAAAIFGALGDLLESKLKRMAGVKDSGNMMPGHGGFLDRFDSLLIATPAVWVVVMLLEKMG